jgi:hypothetical protein
MCGGRHAAVPLLRFEPPRRELPAHLAFLVSVGGIAMSERVGDLLNKALRALEPRERDELLHEVLLDQLGVRGQLPAGPAVSAMRLPPEVDREAIAALLGGELSTASGIRMKVRPVRLPEHDYERSRQFCRASGFSMAVVIRALVERLRDQHGDEHDPNR